MTRLTFQLGLPRSADRAESGKRHGKPGEKFTAAEFRAKCREYAVEQNRRPA